MILGLEELLRAFIQPSAINKGKFKLLTMSCVAVTGTGLPALAAAWRPLLKMCSQSVSSSQAVGFLL